MVSAKRVAFALVVAHDCPVPPASPRSAVSNLSTLLRLTLASQVLDGSLFENIESDLKAKKQAKFDAKNANKSKSQ